MRMTWVETPSGKLRVGKILCLVRNYRAHAEEFNQEVPPEPVFFLKPATAIVHDGEVVVAPPITSDLQAEAELGVVMESTARAVDSDEAYEYVLGYCAFLDITARDIQREAMQEGLPWSLAKGMDTFAPVSAVRPREEVGDPHRLDILHTVNGVPRQKATTAAMIYSVPDIIAHLSAHITLQRGDLIATGTPERVPRVRPGDVLEVSIQGVGKLRVSVVSGP